MTVHKIEIDSPEMAAEIGNLDAQAFDALPFGAIQLDANGVILRYNKAEEKISGRNTSDVLGKNFFADIAPCTRVKRFLGAFQAGVEHRSLNEVFDFTFAFKTGPRDVRIRMIYSEAPRTCVWIFATPL